MEWIQTLSSNNWWQHVMTTLSLLIFLSLSAQGVGSSVYFPNMYPNLIEAMNEVCRVSSSQKLVYCRKTVKSELFFAFSSLLIGWLASYLGWFPWISKFFFFLEASCEEIIKTRKLTVLCLSMFDVSNKTKW